MKGFSIQAFKLLALSKHYRTEGNFTWDILEAAQNRLNNWRAASALRWQVNDDGKTVSVEAASFRKSLLDSLQDDLNTPEALMRIDETLSEFDEVITPTSASILQEMLNTINQLLGIDLNDVGDIRSNKINFKICPGLGNLEGNKIPFADIGNSPSGEHNTKGDHRA